MPWSIPLGRNRLPKLLLQWDFPWMRTPVLLLGQVSPGDEEKWDALVACHRPGGEYGLVCPSPIPIPPHPSASLVLQHHPTAIQAMGMGLHPSWCIQ